MDRQPIPLNDYMPFKKMGGNEILLNLDNCDNLRSTEIVSGLLELGKRDIKQQFDWNNHPIAMKCLNEVKKRLPSFNAKNVVQTPMLLQNLRLVDGEAWNLAAKHALRLLHKYKGRDMAMLMDYYERDIMDDKGEPFLLKKCDEQFFERIVGILPIQVKYLSKEHMIRTLEIIVKKGMGSERLYRDYLLLKIEKNMMKLTVDQYARLLRALADKNYVEDIIFWNQHVFKYIHGETPLDKKPNQKREERTFTNEEAKQIWEALIYLKLKCPTLDVNDHILKIETFLKTGEEMKQVVKTNA